MADEGDIVQTLTVEGVSEAIAVLEAYGGTVARIFSKIGETITSSGGAFESFGATAGVALAAVGIVTAAVVGGFYELAKSASEAVEELARLQAVTGDSIENLSSFKGAVAASGFEMDNLGQAMVRMSQRFATEAPKIAKDIGDLPLTLEKATLATSNADLAYKKLTGTLTSFDKATEESNKKQEAELKLHEAQAAAAKAAAENIVTLTEAYVAMANGQKAVIDSSVPLQKQLEGIVAAVNQIVEKKIDYKQLTPDAKRQEELLQLATILHNVADEETRVGLASQLVGRGFAASLLLMDPEKIRKLQQSFKDLGLEIDKVDEEGLHKFKEASGELGYVWDTLKNKLGAVVSPIFTEFFKSLSRSLEENAGWFKTFGEAANTAFNIIKPYLPQIADGVVLIIKVLGLAVLGFTALASVALLVLGLIAQSIEGLVIAFKDGWRMIVDAGEATWQAIKDGWKRLVQWASDAAYDIAQPFIDAFNYMLDPIKNVINKIKGWILEAIEVAKQLWGYFTGSGGNLSAAPSGTGMARGGVVQGKSGIDANLAYVTAGEFVVQAAAVQKFGVPFFSALNSGVPRFALGGLNTGAMPSIAGGGVSAGSAGRALHLTIEGKTFGPMSVEDSTASALERFAVHSQLARIGRGQSWRK